VEGRGGRIKEKLDALRNGLPELVMMAKVLKTQYDRIKSQRKLEVDLTFPLPNLYKEIESFQKLAAETVNLKADLGFDGYVRVAKQIDMKHGHLHDVTPRMLQAMNDEERENLKEFGEMVVDLIENQEGVHEEMPESSMDVGSEEESSPSPPESA